MWGGGGENSFAHFFVEGVLEAKSSSHDKFRRKMLADEHCILSVPQLSCALLLKQIYRLCSSVLKGLKILEVFQRKSYCQRVRPSEDRRPGEAAAYRAARRFLGGRNLRSASNLSVM